ncbi:2914_t:CDS:2 [Funneliformis caledonium]|uniref:2914_t:CDS:1 n=1 Tax=Funneliformis caledonium TaxID=1117310 RepID=A0A9N9BRF2_9GLOM|nr:2914_t:CDS:2 [Funneliformis caledonium]
MKIDKVSMLKERYGKYSSIFIEHDKNTDVDYIIKYGKNLDLLHHKQEMLNKLSYSYIIKLSLDKIQDNHQKCDQLLKWIQQVDVGFQYAHSQGILYKDYLIDNLIIDTDDNMRIIDWDIFCRKENNS